MPITQPESGLTTEQYNLLETLKTGSTYRVVAHRYNLDFGRVYSSSSVATETTPDFDAIICNGFIYRVVGTTFLERYDIATDTWSTVSAYPHPSSPISRESVSLATDGSVLHAFAATTTGISHCSSSDDGSSWTSWTQIIAVTNLWLISSVSPTRIHYMVKDTTKLIYNLRVGVNDSGWTASASDIWIQHTPTNIAAVEYGTQDVIAIATEVPGINTVTSVNGAVVNFIQPSGGVIVFRYQYDSWSDHVEVDIVDALTAFRYRNRVKLSVINGRLFLTAYASDGTQQFPFTMYRMYTSEDGLWWSKGDSLPLTEGQGASSGIKLLFFGDYIYGVERKQVHRSYSTLATGHSPAAVQVDISDTKRVQEYEVTQGDMFQTVLVLSNANGWLNNNPIINTTNRIILVHSIGYRNPIDFTQIIVQVAITEVDTVDFNTELPKRMVRISSRDKLAWMTDRTGAERPYIWDSQLVGADDYSDYTSTGYDGLRHSAEESGSWSASNNKLILDSSNTEGIVFSTYDEYLWNGTTQTGFSLATVGNHEYAGVVLRATDKDNLLIGLYNQATDKIELRDRTAGIDVVLASSSTLSWASTPLTTRYIRAEFHYARIVIYSSTDGATWTQQISILQSSVQVASADNRKFRGYVGFIGKGFSPTDQSTWTPDPGPILSPLPDPYQPPYEDPYDDPTYDPGTIFPPVPGSTPVTRVSIPSDGNTLIFGDDTHLKMVTTSIILTSPPERDITPPMDMDETISDAKIDRYSPGIYCLTTNGTQSRLWFSSDMGVYPTLEWVSGDEVTGNFTKIVLGDGAGKTVIKGVIPAAPARKWKVNGVHGTILAVTDTSITVEAYHDGGQYNTEIITSDPNSAAEFTGGTVISGSLTTGLTFWSILGETPGSEGHSGLLSSGCINGISNGSFDPYTITYNFSDDCGTVHEGLTIISKSDDYGVTLTTPFIIADALSGFDVQKSGDIILLGGVEQTLTTDGETEFDVYGDPKVQGGIYIPRLLFVSTTNLNDASTPEYLLSSSVVDDDGHSLFKVTALGDAFSNITPMSGGYPGLAVDEYPAIVHWMSSSHILGLWSFNGVMKFARSINRGTNWIYSAALDAGVKGIVTRRGDFDTRQVWWINNDKIAYCSNYQLPVITFVEKTFSLTSINYMDVFG